MRSTLSAPTDWVLEISLESQARIWQQSRAYSTEWAKWNAYLNQLSLATILPWLKAEYLPAATADLDAAGLARVWEVVNGAVITVGTNRIALIPTESIDRSQLEVPQEWVDIPSWAADYYLGVAVSSDCQEVEIYGYVTHQQLKTDGCYDALDRTYCLDCEDLTLDLNSLWLTIDRYTADRTRAAIGPILPLAQERVTPLIERLSIPSVIIPRLTVPFPVWAAILAQPELFDRLDRQRHGGAATPAVTRLGNWFQGQIESAWQTLDAVLLPQQIATSVRSGTRSPQASDIYRVKTYPVATGEIALVVGMSQVSPNESRIDLQIHPAGGASHLPGATQLRLLTIDGAEIGRANATVTETIKFQFRATMGEQFQIEISCAGKIWREKFE